VSALTCARVGIGLSAIVKAIQMWPMLHRLVADPRIVLAAQASECGLKG
jgi:hypothetical protein